MTRQQKWATGAFTRISSVKQAGNAADERKYSTHCMKAPSLLRQSGLVQALAFLQTRPLGGKFLDDVASAHGDSPNGVDLLKRARNAALPEYVRLSREVMGVLTWFRRFAQSDLEQGN